MARARGVALIAGFTKGTTWGTAVNPAAGKAFRPLLGSWKTNIQPEHIEDKSFNADAMARESSLVGKFKPAGSFDMDLKYEAAGLILACFFGTAGTPTGANPYVHTLIANNDMLGIFGTLQWFDGLATYTVDSVKIVGVEIDCKPGGVVVLKVNWVGRKFSISGDTSSLTENSTINRVQWTSAIFAATVSTQAADTLATWDINSYNVKFERPYESDDRAFSSVNGEYMREPNALDYKVTGTITVPHEATTLLSANQVGTLYESKLTHTLSASAIFQPCFPSMFLLNVPIDPTDRGGIPSPIAFTSEKAVTLAASMADRRPYMKLTNTQATDYLA